MEHSSLEVFFQFFKQRPEYLDSIVSISYVPVEAITNRAELSPITLATTGPNDFQVFEVTGGQPGVLHTSLQFEKFEGYPNVTESKLLMFPYSYMELTAWNGNIQELHLENFTPPPGASQTQVNIVTLPFLSQASRVAYFPWHYNGDNNLNNAVIVTDYPEIASVSEGYALWLAQNKGANAMDGVKAVTAGVSAAVGIKTLNPALVVGGLTAIGSTLARHYDAQRIPNNINTQAGGMGFNIGNNIYGCSVVKKMIKPEYREQLTQFWHTFGYAYNKIEVPNLRSRQHFNFIKTIDANIIADFSHDDLAKMKDIFNNGITLWHTNDIGNYNLSNGEVPSADPILSTGEV